MLEPVVTGFVYLFYAYAVIGLLFALAFVYPRRAKDRLSGCGNQFFLSMPDFPWQRGVLAASPASVATRKHVSLSKSGIRTDDSTPP